MIKRRLSSRASRTLVALFWTASIAFAAWIVSGLVARFTAPERVAAAYQAVSDPRLAAQRLATKAPLATGAAPVLAQADGARVAQGFVLVGVATGFGADPGFALLQPTAGEVRPYLVGEEVAPGVRLVALHADHVEIERGGAREIVRLVRSPSPAGAPAVPAPMAPQFNPTAPNPANLR
ncbi:MAG: type II secretion system protein N [Rhodocyclaceae bacterium]